VVHVPADQLFVENGVGTAEDVDAVAAQLTDAANRQARTGERVLVQDLAVNAEQHAQLADLVFEKRAQRLDELHPRILRGSRRRCGGS
jgi:hypothetical protein